MGEMGPEAATLHDNRRGTYMSLLLCQLDARLDAHVAESQKTTLIGTIGDLLNRAYDAGVRHSTTLPADLQAGYEPKHRADIDDKGEK